MTKKRDDEFVKTWPALNRPYGHISAPADDMSGYAAADQGVVRKDLLGLDEICGYIFMCNGKTKPECYQNRVFGLPASRKDVIAKIRPRMKLFLFDYDMKYLYGVYEATADGQLNLESAAFDGKFPAQVRFKIYKECLPLSESRFKHALQANYHKGSRKFNTILNSQQVSHLLSLFQPITQQSSANDNSSSKMNQFQQHARLPPSGSTYFNSKHPRHTPQVSVPQNVPREVLLQPWDSRGTTGNTSICHYSVGSEPAMPAQSTKNQFQSSVTLPSLKDTNAAWAYGGLTSPILEPQYVQPSVPQHISYGYTNYMGNVYPAVQLQAMPVSTQTYHSAGFGQHYLPEVPAQQAPKSYESCYRYEAAQSTVPTYQHTSFGYGYNQLPSQTEGVTISQPGDAAVHPNFYQVPTVPHAPPSRQEQTFTLEELE